MNLVRRLSGFSLTPGVRSAFVSAAAKRIGLEVLGWLLLAVGIAALVLPGPGLLLTFAGLAVLSTQYEWARRWTHPVKIRALRAAAEGVETIPRIAMSTLAALALAAAGVLWLRDPPAPSWWPLDDRWWLLGGPGVAITLFASCVIALALLIYSVRRFYRKPEAVEDIERMDGEHKEEVERAEREEREAEQRERETEGR